MWAAASDSAGDAVPRKLDVMEGDGQPMARGAGGEPRRAPPGRMDAGRGRGQRGRGGRWGEAQQQRGPATPQGSGPPMRQAGPPRASPQAGPSPAGVHGTGYVASIKDTFGFIQCAPAAVCPAFCTPAQHS